MNKVLCYVMLWYVILRYASLSCAVLLPCPRGLTFTWRRYCGLCPWHKPTEFAHSFLFCSCDYFCVYGPFNCILFHKSSRQFSASNPVLPVSFLPYWSVNSLYESLLSPAVICSGWLRWKHRLTNKFSGNALCQPGNLPRLTFAMQFSVVLFSFFLSFFTPGYS